MAGSNQILLSLATQYDGTGAQAAVSDLNNLNSAAKNANSSDSLGGLASTFSNIEGPLSHLGFHSLASDLGATGVEGRTLTEVMKTLAESLGPVAGLFAAGVTEAVVTIKQANNEAKDFADNSKTAGISLQALIPLLAGSSALGKALFGSSKAAAKALADFTAASKLDTAQTSSDMVKIAAALDKQAAAQERVAQAKKEAAAGTGSAKELSDAIQAEDVANKQVKDIESAGLSFKSLVDYATQYVALIASNSRVREFYKDMGTDLSQENELLKQTTSSFSEFLKGVTQSDQAWKTSIDNADKYFEAIKTNTEALSSKYTGLNLIPDVITKGLKKAGQDADIEEKAINSTSKGNLQGLLIIYTQEYNRLASVIVSEESAIAQLKSDLALASKNKARAQQDQEQIQFLTSQEKFFQQRQNELTNADNVMLAEIKRTATQAIATEEQYSASLAGIIGQRIGNQKNWNQIWDELGAEALKDIGEQISKQLQASAVAAAIGAPPLVPPDPALAAALGVAAGVVQGITGAGAGALSAASSAAGSSTTSANATGSSGSQNQAPNQYTININNAGIMDQGTAQMILNGINNLIQNNGGQLSATNVYTGNNPIPIP